MKRVVIVNKASKFKQSSKC